MKNVSMTAQEVMMPIIRVAVERTLSRHNIQNVELHTHERMMERFGGDLAMTLVAYMPKLPHSFERTDTVCYPETWWDAFKAHFKNRWWLRWHVRRHPPRMALKTLTVAATIVAPEIRVPCGMESLRCIIDTEVA